MNSPRKIFVTGGTGFVGGHLVKALIQRGDRVRALCRASSDRRLLNGLPVDWVQGDLLDPGSYAGAMDGCDSVYHCAADYRLFARDTSPMYEINVDGTVALLETCNKVGIKKIVYTSSVAALKVPDPGSVSNESDRTILKNVVGHYKRSKFLAQEAVLEFARKGTPVVLVNPSTPVGPGDLKPTATGKIIVDFLKGKMPAYLDTGLNLVPVEDVAKGHLLAEELGQFGELYILGHLNMSLKEILGMLASITGLPVPRIEIPYSFAWLAGCIDTAVEGYLLNRQPQVPIEGVRMAKKKMYFDAAYAKRELSFSPGSVYQALSRAVAWFVQEGYAPEPPRNPLANIQDAGMRS